MEACAPTLMAPLDLPQVLDAETLPCKICGSPAARVGALDFNRSCLGADSSALPPAGVDIAYHRCPACGFLFSGAFDRWSGEDYRRCIYNSGYAAVDPEYASIRPVSNAGFVAKLLGRHRAALSVLDYGGGNGRLAQELLARGFASARSYDPFTPEYADLPEALFDLVCCFETLEHVPNPLAVIAEIGGFVKSGGMALFSTLLLPADFAAQGLGWWYVAPRNGHIGIFSRDALARAWWREGFHVMNMNDGTHLAFRELPWFATHFIKPSGA